MREIYLENEWELFQRFEITASATLWQIFSLNETAPAKRKKEFHKYLPPKYNQWIDGSIFWPRILPLMSLSSIGYIWR
jgi:hypothetical protein